MAKVKKGDICDAFYDLYHVEKPKKSKWLHVFEHSIVDCCPKCMESIQNRIKKLRHLEDYQPWPAYSYTITN